MLFLGRTCFDIAEIKFSSAESLEPPGVARVGITEVGIASFWAEAILRFTTGEAAFNRLSLVAEIAVGVEVRFLKSIPVLDVMGTLPSEALRSNIGRGITSFTDDCVDCTDTSSSNTFLQLIALTNTPCRGLQLKYLFPWQNPSCFPFASFSSNPTQTPFENSVFPM